MKYMHVLYNHVFHLFHLQALNPEVKQHCILVYYNKLDRQDTFQVSRIQVIHVNTINNMIQM